MKNSIKAMLAISLISSLVGCIKVRGADEEKVSPQAQVAETKVGDITVNGTMYLYQGEILSADEYQHRQEPKAKDVGDADDVTIKMDRLTFKPGGVLYTMGKKVHLQVRDLKSRGGKIATYPGNQTAEMGRNGKSGGHIQLLAQVAMGDLQIELRGEKGGQGAAGENPDDSMRGPKGPIGVPVMSSSHNCETSADGGVGGKGLKGKIGGVGQAGGESGTLELSIQNGEDFEYGVSRFPGAGGSGGDGGKGGIGGLGGDPVDCGNRYGARGPLGPTGDPGDRGPSGPAGQLQTYCVILSGAMTCTK